MINLLVAILEPLLKVQTAPPHIPLGADPVVFRASERYLGYRYLSLALQILPVLIAPLIMATGLMAASAKGKPPPTGIWFFWAILVLAAVIGSAIALVCVVLDYRFHYYVMTDRSLRIRRGIWEQIEATLTYANVQNVRVVQGPIERLFGIASVVVDTAGSAGRSQKQDPLLQHHRGVIRGIEDAQALRDRIMERMRLSKSAGLGDLDDHKEPAHAAETELDLLKAVRDQARGLAAELRATKG